MPFKNIDYSRATKSLADSNGTNIISTSLGNVLLEIQGDLIVPDEKPNDLTPEEEEKFTQLDGQEWAMNFGKLQLDGKRATLFIGNTQRLLGDLKKLDPPLALLKVPEDQFSEEDIQITDVIKYRILFAGRPLPIM